MVNKIIRFLCLLFMLLAFSSPATAQNDFGHFKSYHPFHTGLFLETDRGLLMFLMFSENTVQVSWEEGGNMLWPQTETVWGPPLPADPEITDDDNQILIQGTELEIAINKKNLSIEFSRKGELLSSSPGMASDTGLQGFSFLLDKNEHLYGTGERALPLDRRGQRLLLDNQPHYAYGYGEPNLNYSVPLVLSSKNYLIFFDNPARGVVDLGKSQLNQLTFESKGGPWRYYFIAGDNPESVMESYSQLTGRQPLPPRWAFGNLLSRFGYKNETEVRDIVRKMKQDDFPMDAIIIDLYWFGKGVKDSFYMGNLTWDKNAWPNPKKLISELKQEGIRTILITEPFVLKESKNYQLCDETGLFALDSSGNTYVIPDFWFGLTGLLDIFKPKTRDWFWQQYKNQIDLGVDGWWGDLGEPEKHPGDMMHDNGSADEVHNIYGHIWDKMLFDEYAKNYPDTRLFNLNRSGFAGSQRFGVFPWSGDVSRSWSGLQAQLPIMLGMSQSGVPYMHSDLGGFAMGKKDEELYIRWMQFGTFTPIFRPHGSGIPSEPVYFSDSVQKIVRKYMKLRYRMLPYNYSLAWNNTISGLPLAMPLQFLNPSNNQCVNIENEYYWGKEMLIAPVLERGILSRDIYLPEGQWIDFNTDATYAGARNISYPLTIEDIPVFVKAGSFIPMAAAVSTTSDYNPTYLELHYYPSANDTADYTMYEDDGHSNNSWLTGANEKLHFLGITKRNGKTELNLNRESGDYQGMPESREMVLIVHTLTKAPKNIAINGQEVSLYSDDAPDVFPAAYWDAAKHLLRISWQWNHQPVRILFH